MKRVKYRIEPMPDNPVENKLGKQTGLYRLERWDCDPMNPTEFHRTAFIKDNLTYAEAQKLQTIWENSGGS